MVIYVRWKIALKHMMASWWKYSGGGNVSVAAVMKAKQRQRRQWEWWHTRQRNMQCDSSNDVYCRIKCKQMINFCCIFAFSSVILGHIVERQSDFNKDLFSVPTENRRLKGAERERCGEWDREWERVEKMEMRRYSGMRTRNVNTCASKNPDTSNVELFCWRLCQCMCASVRAIFGANVAQKST